MFRKEYLFHVIRNGRAVDSVFARNEKAALQEYKRINLLGSFYKLYTIGCKPVLIAKSIYGVDVLSVKRISK